MRDLIEFAAALDAPLATIARFRVRLSLAGKDGRSRLIDVMWNAAEHAQHVGVRLAIEPAAGMR